MNSIYITSYMNPHKQLPRELLYASANACIFPKGELAEYLDSNIQARAYLTRLMIDYLHEYKLQSGKKNIKTLSILANENLHKMPKIERSFTDMPPLSWETNALHKNKHFYLISCRQKVLADYQPSSWCVTPPAWFNACDPKVDLYLAEFPCG